MSAAVDAWRQRPSRVAVIGGGFGGLAAAWELTRRGLVPTVIEADSEVGGLAGSFVVGGQQLEKFYHHWFTSDHHVTALIAELGLDDRILRRPTRTGMYFANRIFRLSEPLDVLRFTPLPPMERLRLGLLALRARRVRDWRALEELSAEEWLVRLGGRRVYDVVWRPLLEGKFGPWASEISAVWIWNKLKLRGGSRGRGGAETLAYFRGGFAALATALADAIRRAGGRVLTGTAATALEVSGGRVRGVATTAGPVRADAVLATTPLPVFADLAAPHSTAEYVAGLRRIEHLANVCLVLELDRSLSETYWLNVNDPGFPFVGVIEHTNFEPASSYDGRHIVYLSKYLPESAELFRMDDDGVRRFCVAHLRRMFPEFDESWILGGHVWRAHHSQPIVVRGYGALVPSAETPVRGLYLSTMAQVYPEDRGTNYAIREGRRTAALVAAALSGRRLERRRRARPQAAESERRGRAIERAR